MVSDVNLFPIDLDEFQAFLLAHELDAVVGSSCDDAACPLARFLNAQYAGSFAVNTTEYRRLMDDVCLSYDGDDVYPLPEWAQDFVSLVDESADYASGVPVSALDALCFLHAACSAVGVFVEG